MSAPAESVGALAAIDRARDVLTEIYAKYQLKIGPFASQAQRSNFALRSARDALAELFEALKVCRDALTDYDGWPSDPGNRSGWDSDIGYDAYRRAVNALARVGGEV